MWKKEEEKEDGWKKYVETLQGISHASVL